VDTWLANPRVSLRAKISPSSRLQNSTDLYSTDVGNKALFGGDPFPDAPEAGRSIARLIVILRFASLSRDFFAFIPNQEQTHDR
jgi:hypothetical protein